MQERIKYVFFGNIRIVTRHESLDHLKNDVKKKNQAYNDNILDIHTF